MIGSVELYKYLYTVITHIIYTFIQVYQTHMYRYESYIKKQTQYLYCYIYTHAPYNIQTPMEEHRSFSSEFNVDIRWNVGFFLKAKGENAGWKYSTNIKADASF